ncbi:MAG: sigma-70 family RNA polymerase sigma factor [Thermoanaerobaculum sp.]|nr:sigma-70 family RNA polymerase sigma factor [Thermoanaerobaculum sp.]
MATEFDGQLLARAQAGELGAQASLLAQQELVVWRTCRALLPPGEDLEGAVQEVMLKMLENLKGFRGNGSMAAWAARIAANYCRDLWRRRRQAETVHLDETADEGGFPVAVLPSPSPDPEQTLRARQGWQRLQKALALLPERQREAFALRFLADLNLQQVAEAMGVDVGTVKTHLHRAVAALRAAVREAWP